jgi:hypothetical protein
MVDRRVLHPLNVDDVVHVPVPIDHVRRHLNVMFADRVHRRSNDWSVVADDPPTSAQWGASLSQLQLLMRPVAIRCASRMLALAQRHSFWLIELELHRSEL